MSVILLFVGCASKLAQPAVQIPESFKYGNEVVVESDSVVVWWHNFADPMLQSLINEAIDVNRSIGATIAALNAARHNLRVAKSSYLPSLSLDVDAERYREERVYAAEYSITPTISWQIPLFGAYRATRDEYSSLAISKEWAARGAMLTLASDVATAYYSLLMYRAALEVSQSSCQLRSDATTLIDSMYRYGMSSRVDLEQARSLVYAAQNEVDSYIESIRLTELSLSLLLNRDVDFSLITLSLNELQTPAKVASGVPSDLLYNRPDLRESYFKMMSAMGAVGVARAAQFPSLALTVDGGLFSSSLSGLTLAKMLTWEWAVDLAQPIFNFAALKSQRKAAVADYEAALLSYEQSILDALKDVESALVEIGATREKSLSQRRYMDSYEQIARSTSALYRGGMSSYLNVVDAEREYLSSQISYIELIAQQQINYVNLFTALGGRL